ncbi:MAG: hypothetical protein ACPGOY_11485 [Rhodospirillaceae bacterium]
MNSPPKQACAKPSGGKRPAPFSIRLSAEERAYLERKAGNRPLGGYIRKKLLGDHETPRKAARLPAMDYVMLGQVLAMLGTSDLGKHLCLLAVAAERGALIVDDEVETELKSACADVRTMRGLLVSALGLVDGSP